MEAPLLSKLFNVVNQEIHFTKLLGWLGEHMPLLIRVTLSSELSVDAWFRAVDIVIEDVFLIKDFILRLLAFTFNLDIFASAGVSRVNAGASERTPSIVLWTPTDKAGLSHLVGLITIFFIVVSESNLSFTACGTVNVHSFISTCAFSDIEHQGSEPVVVLITAVD
jgi:hypothetical protein